MVRAANTGISAVIDAHGDIRRSIPLGQAGAFTAALPVALAPTPYTRTKEWPSLLLIVMLMLLGAVKRWGGRDRKTD